MKRESFIFYRSFMEALDELNDEQFARVFRAICKFALDEKELKLSGVEKAIFQLVKPQLLANQKRYENGCKGGRKASENKPNDNQKETENKPNQNQLLTKVQPNDNVNDNENVNVNVNEKDNLKINKKNKITNKQCVASVDSILFEGVLADMEKEVAPITYDTFFRTIGCLGCVDDTLVLTSPMPNAIDRHRDKLVEAITKTSKGKFVDYVWE